MSVPQIVNQEAYNNFKDVIIKHYKEDPDSKWYGGYVDYEWNHLRHSLLALPFSLDGINVLEFGCNIGASTVVLACHGAYVTAIDVNPYAIQATNYNVSSYGKEMLVKTFHVPDTTKLPFPDNHFKLIIANSVLEYVPDTQIDAVLEELKRVLSSNGVIMIMGTANRLAFREIHSNRWFVNYVPKFFDKIFGIEFQRGISPLKILNTFKEYDLLELKDYSQSYLETRKKFGWSKWKCYLFKSIAHLIAPLGLIPSLLTPSITATFQKNKKH